MQLIDIGANLAHASFDADRDEVIAAAVERGVEQLVVTGSCAASSKKARVIASEHRGRLFATAGVHPHHASDFDEESAAIVRALAANDEVVAVGECGLDYFRNFSPRAEQLRAFTAQLEIAAELGAPVFLHQRGAYDDFVATLQPWLGRIPRAVAHCFTDGEKELEGLLELGLYIGITGWICDERRGVHLKDIVGRIPANRIMIESDAPYLLPRTLSPRPKTRRNEPRWLPEVLTTLAAARGELASELAAQTTVNARHFFGLRSVMPRTACLPAR